MPDPAPDNSHTAPRPSRLGMWSWALYDWATNAYATIIITFVFAAYFIRNVAEDETTGTVQWTLALGIGGILIGIGGPIVGATVDRGGRRKMFMALFTLVCAAAAAGLWFVQPAPAFLLLALGLVALGELGMEYAGVLYNAMLPRLVGSDRIGRWSGWGWSMGYAGGLASLIVALLVFVGIDIEWLGLDAIGAERWLGLDPDAAEPIRATFLLAAIWVLVFAIPLFLFTPDPGGRSLPVAQAVRAGLGQLADSIRNIRRYGHIVRFLIARLIYIDGLATVFILGGVYAAGTFDMTEAEVLMFGIALNVAAGLGALSFSWIDDRIGGRNTILLSLIGLTVPGIAILLVESPALFWTFGLLLGIFVGPVQAASRSYMARIAPPDLRNQMFGLYAFSGKVAFLCPLLVGAVTGLTASQRIGMSVIMLFFAAGFLIMLGTPRK